MVYEAVKQECLEIWVLRQRFLGTFNMSVWLNREIKPLEDVLKAV
jgi:HAMP domain-containing protein